MDEEEGNAWSPHPVGHDGVPKLLRRMRFLRVQYKLAGADTQASRILDRPWSEASLPR